jgi:hypothetical protein
MGVETGRCFGISLLGEAGLGTDHTINDLILQVPEGESKLFERKIKDAVENRFFRVYPSHKYYPRLDWINKPEMTNSPWSGSRGVPRKPLSILSNIEAHFEGSVSLIVDLYGSGGDAFFISNKLTKLIESFDPGSLERTSIIVGAEDGTVDYNIVMTSRNIEAIDVDRTDILIGYENLGGQWFRDIQFPNDVVFRSEMLADIHCFSDADVHGWFWSRELIDAAKAAGIRGLYTKPAGKITGSSVDEL